MINVLEEYKPEINIPFPKRIRFHPDLNHGEKIFLAEIEAMTSNGQAVPCSSRRIAEIFGVSHQTVINWIKKLSELDLIKIECDYNNPYNKILIKNSGIK